MALGESQPRGPDPNLSWGLSTPSTGLSLLLRCRALYPPCNSPRSLGAPWSNPISFSLGVRDPAPFFPEPGRLGSDTTVGVAASMPSHSDPGVEAPNSPSLNKPRVGVLCSSQGLDSKTPASLHPREPRRRPPAPSSPAAPASSPAQASVRFPLRSGR